MTELLHRELTGKILRAYYNVYNGLSRTYPEFVYENAMMRELTESGVHCIQQPQYQIYYKEWLVGLQRLDVLVAEEVVVEGKVKPALNRLHQVQTVSYLKTIGKQVGLLLNFGSSRPEFKRIYFTARQSQPMPSSPEQAWPDLLFPELTYQAIGGLFEVYNELGPGYVQRIYANAAYREVQQRGLAAKPFKRMQVLYRGHSVGVVKLGHLQIEDRLMIFPVAVRETEQVEPENLRRWMESQGIPLGILANFHAARLELVFMRSTGRG